jgi:hypothetical protein
MLPPSSRFKPTFNPEDRDSLFLQNIGIRTFNPEDGGSMFLQSVVSPCGVITQKTTI